MICGGRSRFRTARTAALIITALLLAACSGTVQPPPDRGQAADPRPNIIFVLTDDLSWNLVQHMPNVRRMQQQGLTFTNFFVTNSLCCPSRATIFTGRFPHNTGVHTNEPPDGGYQAFRENGGEQHAFAPFLRSAGYRTGYMGKYFNGYLPTDTYGGKGPYVPPGWDDWRGAGNGYFHYDYNLNENGRKVHYGNRPEDYLTDVLAAKSTEFITASAAQRKPFMLQVSTFSPHGPFVPAPRHTGMFPDLKAPRPPSFNEPVINDKPRWLRVHPKLRPAQLREIDRVYRDRARSVQAVDEMIGRIRETLRKTGRDRDTYVMFGSDNGFHLGEHRLAGGKMTAFDTDIKVPLIITGPGVPAGAQNPAVTQTTDLAPTFYELTGAKSPPQTDGRSLVPLLRGTVPADWRNAALIEHRVVGGGPGDPDRQTAARGRPPSYLALRTATELYVEYKGGQREYYDVARDPHQLANAFPRLSPQRRQWFSAALRKLAACTGPGCATADRLT